MPWVWKKKKKKGKAKTVKLDKELKQCNKVLLHSAINYIHYVIITYNGNGKNSTNRFAQGRVATNLQFVKDTVTAKHNKAKY